MQPGRPAENSIKGYSSSRSESGSADLPAIPFYRRKDVLVGGVEAGGTKFVCGIGHGPDSIVARKVFPTGCNSLTRLQEVIEWFRYQNTVHGPIEALGLACFGPLDLAPTSPTYGHITRTPKHGWSGVDILGHFRRAHPDIPIAFETDVNGAALGEFFWGGAQGLADFTYITIGTGIGAGGMAAGRLLHGLIHPEVGHMRLPRIAGDNFPGICEYHSDCWEGLCCGPAIKARTGIPAEYLSTDHPVWGIISRYVAIALVNIIYTLSPRRVIVGGSVRKAGIDGEEFFFRAVREQILAVMNGYPDFPALQAERLDEYVVSPLLGDDAGLLGAIALAQCQYSVERF